MVKKVLVINDIPGTGKVAGNINIPMLTAAKIETSILPTLILSTHTGGDYQNIVVSQMEESFGQMLNHWQSYDMTFDGYLTGYFANPQQIDQFSQYYQTVKQEKDSILVMDPIMGDSGQFYDGFNTTILDAFSKLMPAVDIIMPNLTEAAFLSQLPYKDSFTESDYYTMAKRIYNQGVRNVVLTGVQKGSDQIGFFLLNKEFPQGKYIMHQCFYPEMFGTGDIVVSLTTALSIHGYSLTEALNWIGRFIESVFEMTFDLNRERRWGLYYEPLLSNIAKFLEESNHVK